MVNILVTPCCNIMLVYVLQKKGKAVPLQAWSGPVGSRKLRFPDFMKTAQDGGKVGSLTHRSTLPPENTPGTHFYSRLSRPQGHSTTGSICQWKIPMILSGIEPATYRLVAYCLNHYATARPGVPAECTSVDRANFGCLSFLVENLISIHIYIIFVLTILASVCIGLVC